MFIFITQRLPPLALNKAHHSPPHAGSEACHDLLKVTCQTTSKTPLYQFRLGIVHRKMIPCPRPHPTVFRVLLQQWIRDLKTEWVRRGIRRERLEGNLLLVASQHCGSPLVSGRWEGRGTWRSQWPSVLWPPSPTLKLLVHRFWNVVASFRPRHSV